MNQNNSDPGLTDILERFVNGNATESEKQRVVEWFESLDNKRNASLDEAARIELRQRMWSKISASLPHKKEERRVAAARYWIAGAAAACIMFFLAYIHFFSKTTTNAITLEAIAETSRTTSVTNTTSVVLPVDLPDGSHIYLKPAAQIHYNDMSNDSSRVVILEGEAFFDVMRDEKKPFIVHAHSLTTTVLGTSFNIEAPDENEVIVVAVKTGRVSVQSKSVDDVKTVDQKVVLTPNQRAIFDPEDRKLIATLVTNPTPVLRSQDKNNTFDEEPVINILKSLEGQYGVTITYSDSTLIDCKVTTTFIQERLYDRLDILTRAIGATYSVEGTSIIVHSNGCN
jgi:transmembrane sensor